MPCKSVTCAFIQISLVKLIKATGQPSRVPAVLFRLAVSILECVCVVWIMHMHGLICMHMCMCLLCY